MRVVVVGAGVIGLTCAHRLIRAGHAVEVWSRDAVQDTTSAVAAALWYPYRAFPEDAVTRWSAATYDMLAILSVRPETGVAWSAAGSCSGSGGPDPWWAAAVPRLGRVPTCRPGTRTGTSSPRRWCGCPPTCPGCWTSWPRPASRSGSARLADLAAVPRRRGRQRRPASAPGELAGDPALTGVRGQVVGWPTPGWPAGRWTRTTRTAWSTSSRAARRRLRRHRVEGDESTAA